MLRIVFPQTQRAAPFGASPSFCRFCAGNRSLPGRFPPPDLPGSGQPRSGVLDDQFALELVEGGGYAKEQAPFRPGGRDACGAG